MSKPTPGVATYITGLELSAVLTLIGYAIVYRHALNGHVLVAAVIALAFTQFFAQLYLFLHIGKEKSPRWKLTFLWFAVVVVAILVVGSIWIMDNLNYTMMQPTQRDTYIIQDEGISK